MPGLDRNGHDGRARLKVLGRPRVSDTERSSTVIRSTTAATTVRPDQADEPTSILMVSASGTPREHYFEGMAQLGDIYDEERRELAINNDNFFTE